MELPLPCSRVAQFLLVCAGEGGVGGGWCGTKQHISTLPSAIMHQAVSSPLAEAQAGAEQAGYLEELVQRSTLLSLGFPPFFQFSLDF